MHRSVTSHEMSNALKTLHDQLLALKPDGVVHPEDCQFCGVEVASMNVDGGSVSDKTYSEAEYNALASQVADLEGKITELRVAAVASQTDEAVAAAKAEAEAQVAELQAKLDSAVLEAAAATAKYDEIVALLQKAELEAAEAAERAARREERLARVKEVAHFPEDYLAENIDRFAAMSDEAFEVTLDGFKAQQAALAASTDGVIPEIPAETAMTAARTNPEGSNPLTEVLSLRLNGIDARTV